MQHRCAQVPRLFASTTPLLSDEDRQQPRHTQLAMATTRLIGRAFRSFIPFCCARRYSPRPLEVPRRYARCQPPPSPPCISLVTPSLNQAHFLEQAIQSVLDQNYPNLEYVLQDGGSTDGSIGILRRYAGAIHHLDSSSDEGQTNALNRAFARTRGEIMGWLNSDDLLLPGALNDVASYFVRHPHVDVVYGHRVLIDEQGQEIGRWLLPPYEGSLLSWICFIPQETMFWRRRVWEKVGGALDERLQFCMDWDLMLRFREAGARFARLPRFLGAFRVHPQQKTITQPDVGRREMNLLRERHLGYVPRRSTTALRASGFVIHHLLYHALYRAGVLAH